MAAAVVCSAGCAAPGPVGGRPLEVRTLHPAQLTVPIVGPRPPGATTRPEVGFGLGLASLWLRPGRGTGRIELDGEILRAEGRIRLPLATRADLTVRLPVLFHSGGFLDGLIIGWHDLFGLPQNERDRFPRNRSRVEAEAAGGRLAYRLDQGLGLGDAQIETAWFPVRNGPAALGLRFGFELPTGSAGRGFGNGGYDVFTGFVAGWHTAHWAFELWGGKSFVRTPAAARRAGIRYPDPWSLGAGVQTGLGAGWTLLAQLQAEPSLLRALTDSHARHSQLELQTGLRRAVGRGSHVEASFGEDLVNDVGPDVQFQLGFVHVF